VYTFSSDTHRWLQIYGQPVHVLVEPSHGRGSDDRTKRPAEGGLVCEAAFQSNLRKWSGGRPQQKLSALHPAGDEVTVNWHSEGPREMANREPALLSKARKPKLTIQVAVDQFHQATLLLGCQPTQMGGPRGPTCPYEAAIWLQNIHTK